VLQRITLFFSHCICRILFCVLIFFSSQTFLDVFFSKIKERIKVRVGQNNECRYHVRSLHYLSASSRFIAQHNVTYFSVSFLGDNAVVLIVLAAFGTISLIGACSFCFVRRKKTFEVMIRKFTTLIDVQERNKSKIISFLLSPSRTC
jgi:hypothetical protein